LAKRTGEKKWIRDFVLVVKIIFIMVLILIISKSVGV